MIGVNNQLPWHLPADLKHFKSITSGHPIIMGRKTWDSLGRPLPNRRNMVISRQNNLQLEGAECFTSLENALRACHESHQIFIIGGAQIYAEALPLVDQLIITQVQLEVLGDAYFPDISEKWKEVDREDFPSEADPKNPSVMLPAYAFVRYERREK